MADEKKWDTINTRREDNVPALCEELGKLLKAEKGVSVGRPDAVALALREAIERRTAAAVRP